MFQEVINDDPVKTVENVYQGQEGGLPIGTRKYANTTTELGFFYDGPNVVMNAYFDPSESVRAAGFNLESMMYVQAGRFLINQIPCSRKLHLDNADIRNLGDEILEESSILSFLDAYDFTKFQSVTNTKIFPPISFATWQFKEDVRFRTSNFLKFPQSYGSLVNLDRRPDADVPIRPSGQYKKVFMQKSMDMNPLDLPGLSSTSAYLRTIDFSDFTLSFEFPAEITPVTATDFNVISRLLERGVLPGNDEREYLDNSRQFIDISGYTAFMIPYQIPQNNQRNAGDSRVVFVVWGGPDHGYGYMQMNGSDLKDEFQQFSNDFKSPDLETINQRLQAQELPQIVSLNQGIEIAYEFVVAPCAFHPRRLQANTIGYDIRLLEGFSTRIARTWTQAAGWEQVPRLTTGEFNPWADSPKSNRFRKAIRLQLQKAYSANFQVRFF
jgi:hypothetical protein